MKYLYIFIGSGTGGALRYAISRLVYSATGTFFPYGTLAVNLIGCFMIGALSGLSERWIVPSDARLFIFTGLLGGFTTFSSFGLETFGLLEKGETFYAVVNVLASVAAGLLLVAAGYGFSRLIIRTAG